MIAFTVARFAKADATKVLLLPIKKAVLEVIKI
jgi:hypothetical protein